MDRVTAVGFMVIKDYAELVLSLPKDGADLQMPEQIVLGWCRAVEAGGGRAAILNLRRCVGAAGE